MMLNFQACPDVDGTESSGKSKFNQKKKKKVHAMM